MAANLYNFWLMAQSEPLGIYIQTPDPTRLKGLLYTARAKANDSTIANIIIRTAPNNKENEIWLIKGPPIEGVQV